MMDDRPEKHYITLKSIQFDVVESFYNHEDKICPGSSCELATIA